MAIKKTTTKKAPAKKASTTSISIGLGSNKAEMRKWEIESAMSTLKRAAEIQNDSKLMSDVKKMAMEQAKMFNNLANGKMK
jgi:7,8-dihydro-6-hydroxymethylpterin-pyrophosphokinase